MRNFILSFLILALPLFAGGSVTEVVVVSSKKLNSQEIELFPAKDRLPGMLWGYNYKYTPGMLMLKVSCGASDEMEVETASGDDEEIYVDPHRVEIYQFSEGKDWEYKAWARFPRMPFATACQSLTDMGGLASASRKLRVQVKFEGSGIQHRNVILSWEM